MNKGSKGRGLESDKQILREGMKHGVINDTIKSSEGFLELSKSEKYYRLSTRFSTKEITN
jgi:hypothetical protein